MLASNENADLSSKASLLLSRIQYLSLCFTLFLAGWNDGTIGPLLSRIQDVYHVNFTVVSTIFIFACVGFIGGALLNIYATGKFGFGKVIVFGSVCQIVAYAIQCAAPPFPVFVMTYAVNGVGVALQDAQANGFVASLSRRPEAKMGILHAAYGLGAFASPLVSTQFAVFPRWSFFFFVSLGLSVANTIVLCLVFRFKDQDECLRQAGEVVADREPAATEENAFTQVLRNKSTHIIAFFALVYVGVEVTIGGWIVTFIKDVRGGGPSSGYISSGFFGGLTVGRVALIWVNQFVGERRVMYIYALLSIGLELIIWLVPSLIGNAVAISIVGVLLGPMFPIVINQASRVIPRKILTASIGWIASFGQAGSAVFPFMTGAVAQKHGIHSLQPMLIAMMGFMTILWALVPNPARRTD
ncbi:MFS general substrate transporter [Agrocybe pediades]|nr:MFS general substrate transporter [Agrocybe pediades]